MLLNLGLRPPRLLLAYPPLLSYCRLVCRRLRRHLGLHFFTAMLQCKANLYTY